MISKYFKIHELVPKKMYKKKGEKCWNYIDVRLIESIDLLKEHFNLGTMTINNYYWGGARNFSGIRTRENKYFSHYSMHTYGKAVDVIFSHYTAEEVRNHIINNQHKFKHIKGMELKVDWLHIDVRNEDKLILF